MNPNKRWKIVAVTLVVLLGAFAHTFAAQGSPLRSGKVFEEVKSGIWSWIGARDSQGDEFWVMAASCTVGIGGTIEVLEGDLHRKLKVEAIDRVFEDCYEGRLIRVNGQELTAYGAHDLPEGCIDLGGGAD